MLPSEFNESESFEKALAQTSEDNYVLRLYVTGTSPRSLRAIQSLREMCAKYLSGQFLLEVVDIYQQPDLAQTGNLVVTPTLIKSLPLPERRAIGDLSNIERVLSSLDIVPAQRNRPETEK